MNEILTKKKLREFGFLVGLGIPIIIGLIIPIILNHSFRLWTLFLGGPLLILAIFYPKLLFYPYKFWICLGNLLGRINSSLILGLVYICLLIPIAFIMKIFGYDPLKSKKVQTKTYKEITKYNKIDLNNGR